MTALDDAIAKADGQLRMCRERSPHATMPCESTACQLARALKAVDEALEEAEQSRWGPVPHPLRAAIERRLTEGK